MHAYLSAVTCDSELVDLGSGEMRFMHRWTPSQEEPWGCLSIIHGFGDHGGRFAGMATSLASIGLGVVACDLVGHGRSPGKRGVIASYDHLLDDVERTLEHSVNHWPKIPHFLFGQSMGGNLVLNWALRREAGNYPLMGLVAGSPMLRSPKTPKEQIMNAGRWLAQRMPNFRIPAPVQVSKLSQDRRAQDAYLRDPWVHRSMSLRLAAGLIDSGLWAIEHAAELSLPTLVMNGTEDALTCPEGTKEFAERAGNLVTHRSWHGCRHDLHDEPQRERVFAYMIHWLKHRCLSSTVSRVDVQRECRIAA
ncbi:MAG: lysophospholipase [Pirellula sp.]|nr:lysophospholipase [Pirellula sp.]